MTRLNELKGYGAFSDDDDTISFVSGRLTGASGFGSGLDELQTPRSQADAQKRSELQSLLLMASLMLGDRSAIPA
jgi:hypothetical protein